MRRKEIRQEGECELCGLPLPDEPVEGDGGSYCCQGCFEVDRILSEEDLDTGTDDSELGKEEVRTALDASSLSSSQSSSEETPPHDQDLEHAFLSVEGMHCSTCEVFTETVAEKTDGVSSADSSYASEMMKVEYDPTAISLNEIVSQVSGMGYEVTKTDEQSDTSSEIARVLVGGFFGMMIMVWYVLFLYPYYFGYDLGIIDLNGTAGAYLFANMIVMTSVVVFYSGYPILRGAYVSIRAGTPNMDLLISVAVLAAFSYSVGATLLGETEVYYDVAVVVVVVVSVGNYYEDRMKRRASGLIEDLTQRRVSEARIRNGEETRTVSVDDLSEGDEVVVKQGERVPVDGEVIEGTASLDESLVTGEPIPETKNPGDRVLGGTVVTDNAIVVEVGEDAISTVDRLVNVVWEIQASTPGAQKLADKIAAVFVPLVFVLASAGGAVTLYSSGSLPNAFLTSLTVLIVSCPCALGLATPLAVASGLREALDKGIVIRNESVFEKIEDSDVLAFDKTGTLSRGEMSVTRYDGSEEALSRARAVESMSNHPIADAVVEYATESDQSSNKSIADVEDFHNLAKGVSAWMDDEKVVVGHPELFDSDFVVPQEFRETSEEAFSYGEIPVYIGWDGEVKGVAVVGDEPRDDWTKSVKRISDISDAEKIVVLTGDSSETAHKFEEVADEVFTGLPPEAKEEVVQRFSNRTRKKGGSDRTVAMVGDGNNDAPALAAADIGIAVGEKSLASNSADAVVIDPDLRKTSDVFRIASATRSRIRQNLGWAFLYNAVAIPLALSGNLNPLFAAVAMSTSSLIVVLNSSRPLTD